MTAGLLLTPGTSSSPVAINDLAYNISTTIMKNCAEAQSPPPYWVQFIKGFMLIGDVKLGLSIIECPGNQVAAISSQEWLSFWTYSSDKHAVCLQIQ